jgi:PhzF family phenazine biosynthesis protein
MRQYLVDAFADAPFKGNPACVVEPFDAWPDDAFLAALAMENNQAETAYLLKTAEPGRFGLRWFTPAVEVLLCGHATLASAHILFNELGLDLPEVRFDTLSGTLSVRRLQDGRLEMDFPAYMPEPLNDFPDIEAVLGVAPVALFGGPALIAQLGSETAVRALQPNVGALSLYQGAIYKERHIVVTALADKGKPYDVISRFFAPGFAIAEDPATGSMHCMLAPLYQKLTGKAQLNYYQAHPKRGADLQCEVQGDRVKLRGRAITVARCELLF